MMEVEGFAPIFGEPKVEWLNSKGGLVPLSHPFVFHVHAPDPSHLRFCATDFRSNTWEATRSGAQVEGMRDEIGVGGALSEFVHYITASLKLGDVRLCVEGALLSACAKLMAQRSKGMPVFSISLSKLSGSAASEATATLALALFHSLRHHQCSLLKEQGRSLQLATIISTQKEKYESIQSQLRNGQYTKKQKLQNMNASNSPDKSVGLNNTGSTKVTNRVVPAHRRAKTRGALLQDSEEDNEMSEESTSIASITLEASDSTTIGEQECYLQSTSVQEEKKQELQNTNASANVDGFQKSHEKHVAHDTGPTKVTNHVVPARRRGRTKGALLQDNEDDNGR